MNTIISWFKDNWNEETNVGKAKIAGLITLVFLFFAGFVPPSDNNGPTTTKKSAAMLEQTASSLNSTNSNKGEAPLTQAAANARLSYDAYTARVAELESANSLMAEELAAARLSLLEKDKKIAQLEASLETARSNKTESLSELFNPMLQEQLDNMKSIIDDLQEKLKQNNNTSKPNSL